MRLAGDQWLVLYDASREPPSGLVFPLIGLVLVGIALVGLRLTHFERDERGETRKVRGSPRARAFMWFSAAWAVLAAVVTIVPHIQLVRALRQHEYTEVSGAVEEFVPANILAKTPERWTVSGHRYELYDSRIRSGLSSPGYVRPGMEVRVADVRGAIARLEVHQ